MDFAMEENMRWAVGFTLALISWATPSFAAAPSFDCGKASGADEKAICSDGKLSALDVALNDGYKRMVAALGKDVANKVHGPFLRRRHACKADGACILNVGQSELSVLKLADPAFVLPAGFTAPPAPDYDVLKKQFKPGECMLSTIAELGPRLCEPDANGNCPTNMPFDDSGDSINAASGVHGVSYERIAALEKSTRGDNVLLCLKSIPKHCPKDDDRGYWWNWKNLRTGGKWQLPDAQHMCGGA
jgi:uncharacterized protein